MIDAKLNNYLRPYLIFLAKIIIKLNISANIITFLGFFFGLCCFYSIINFYFMSALLFLFLNRFCDGLDGTVARLLGPTDIGAFYDITLDFLFYSLFPIAFIFIDIKNTYAICFLLLSFVSTQTTFLASAWIIEKNKFLVSTKQKKSFFYIGGITEGFETIICFILMLFFYESVEIIAYIFGILCWITSISRLIFIKKLLRSYS
ncbi:MAG: CDP-alcohol phosphatidyltransferase family protein [Alphaproteobacteria bacterium]|nr:CDP-alcohol phosphatidyltransferase family protein [Alphaproteobacteria bacterium]